MFPIVKKRVLNETVTLMEIKAPLVARKALPGQFIIFRIPTNWIRLRKATASVISSARWASPAGRKESGAAR